MPHHKCAAPPRKSELGNHLTCAFLTGQFDSEHMYLPSSMSLPFRQGFFFLGGFRQICCAMATFGGFDGNRHMAMPTFFRGWLRWFFFFRFF